MKSPPFPPSWTIDGRNEWRVTLSQIGNQQVFHIREWYPKTPNNFAPGSKGISLGTKQLTTLISALSAVKEHADELGYKTSN